MPANALHNVPGQRLPLRAMAAAMITILGPGCLLDLSGGPVIVLDPGTRYQTFTGWEATAEAGLTSGPAFQNYKKVLFDRTVDDLGITRVRLEVRSGAENARDYWTQWQEGRIDYKVWRSHRYANVNDNEDAGSINWSGFHFSEMDHVVDCIVLPLKRRLEARGARLHVNVCYVSFIGQNAPGLLYLHHDPEEYAEFVLATYRHLQEKYGWVPDTWEVILEPENTTHWDGRLIGRAIVAAARRLKDGGFAPRFVAPSTTRMDNAVRYFEEMIRVPGVLDHLEELSYHRYGGVGEQHLRAIARRARRYGLRTAMLEHMGSSHVNLHKDLTLGCNSAWSGAYSIAGYDPRADLFNISDKTPHPRIRLTRHARFYRQYSRFIRPGAVRIKATGGGRLLDPVAFINPDGRYVVVVRASGKETFRVRGLPPGTYGITYTTATKSGVDLPDVTIAKGQELRSHMTRRGVVTIYGK